MTQQDLIEGGSQPAAPTQQPSILTVIDRMASDPNSDIDKLERMVKLYQDQLAKQAETEFAKAMNACQSEIGRVATNKTNTQTSSQYADYAAIDRVVRPVYSEHGFALSFTTGTEAADGYVHVICHVSHSAGHARTYDAMVPSDGKGAKGNAVMTRTHAYGSGLQYGMRYLIKLIFNIAIGEDDDGNSASEADLIDEHTQADINALIDEVCDTKENRAKFSEWIKTAHKIPNGFVRNIPTNKAEVIVEALNKKRAAK